LRHQLHLIAIALVAVSFGPVHAQRENYTSEDAFRDLPPAAAADRGPTGPKLAFQLQAEIPLPGPLPGAAPRLRDELIEIEVAGGTAVTEPIAGATARLITGTATNVGSEERAAPQWAEEASGRFRYRSIPGGKIESQRRCKRCKSGWKRRWKLRVPGNTPATPLVADDRVYFGALDNRVYCVKARNGHRVWVADIGARVTLPLIRWEGERPTDADSNPETTEESSETLRLILAVPSAGDRMVALDARSGQPVATIRLPDGEGTLVSSPLATPDGKIVLARQKYAASEASLMVYRLREIRATETERQEASESSL